MVLRTKLLATPVCVALLLAGDQAWREKRVADWTAEDAKQVLNDSPWVKTVTPTVEMTDAGPRRGGGMGRGGSIGIGIPGIGIPGIGGHRGGMGGGGYPNGRPSPSPSQPPTLTVRWESALPIREAELKARETNAPTVDEGSYAIAVYGVPDRIVNGRQSLSVNDLKKHAALKRQGKKDLKPSRVEILQREDGPVILYSFPRSTEITRGDSKVDFQAQIGGLKVTQSFVPGEMVYQGRIEL